MRLILFLLFFTVFVVEIEARRRRGVRLFGKKRRHKSSPPPPPPAPPAPAPPPSPPPPPRAPAPPASAAAAVATLPSPAAAVTLPSLAPIPLPTPVQKVINTSHIDFLDTLVKDIKEVPASACKTLKRRRKYTTTSGGIKLVYQTVLPIGKDKKPFFFQYTDLEERKHCKCACQQ